MSELYGHACAYVAAGWAITPLHHMDGDKCSCGSSDEQHHYRQGGKHPVRRRWQLDPITTIDQVGQVWGHNGSDPNANIGGLTGGKFWALDMDPDNGARIDDIPGLAGVTRTHQTGSGGQHFIFEVDDFLPTNARGSLPPGWDVRGAGGQIVLPPSRSGKGPYVATVGPAPRPAPRHVKELIRCRPAPKAPVTSTAGAAISLEGSDRRLLEYVRRAADGVLEDLATAAEGDRNQSAFRAACRLIELSNAKWSTLTLDAAYDAYSAACAKASSSGGHPFTSREAENAWLSARGRVGVNAAEAPPDLHEAQEVAVPAVPPAAPDATGLDPPELPRVESPDGEPERQRDGRMTIGGVRLLSCDDLGELQSNPPLLHGLLDLNTAAWVIAAPGVGKSAVALSMAAHITAGAPWCKHRAPRRRPVLYVAAEGAVGLRWRVQAWGMRHPEVPIGDLYILPSGLNVNGPMGDEWEELGVKAAQLGVGMIVLDTQARLMAGLDENSSADMSAQVQRVDALKEATGACILSLHHMGRAGSGPRGHSVLDGAADTVLTLTRPIGVGDCSDTGTARLVELETTKQKDREPAARIRLRIESVALPRGADPEDPYRTAPVIVEGWPDVPDSISLRRNSALQADILQAMSELTLHGEFPTRLGDIVGILPRKFPARVHDFDKSGVTVAVAELIQAGAIGKQGADLVLLATQPADEGHGSDGDGQKGGNTGDGQSELF